ncbi:non-hydrolyzing UDP-N-acetylglucosamine 2-epimerase [Sutcliffiella horikoshii]|uniref:non-hydrolyzing UDP-N-acetylglucosamine 2-epimerase n=1 Tax=Sutcliffiella horikoshii TaxID=79883 RepID=UPI003CF0B441
MKIVTIVGARPQFIKAAPLSLKLKGFLEEVIVNTGQHYDYNMSDIFINELKLPKPDYNLKVGSKSHAQQTAQMLIGIEEILLKEKPNMVLVYGDTNSTLAGSLASAKLQIPVAHVESGLRSFNKAMPEEINRILTDHTSSYLFCPTRESVRNLTSENITENVFLVGDIMYDATLLYKDLALQKSSVLEKLQLTNDKKNYYLLTIHRAENTDNPDRLFSILNVLNKLDKKIIFPIHPRTMKMISHFNLNHLLKHKNIILIDPVSYLDMLNLESHAGLILTDSGGVQKEAYMLKVPCVTLRNETEWVETTENGWNEICGYDSDFIYEKINSFKTPNSYEYIFGDGNSAGKIVNILSNYKK